MLLFNLFLLLCLIAGVLMRRSGTAARGLFLLAVASTVAALYYVLERLM
jgi:hypothetical protein